MSTWTPKLKTQCHLQLLIKIKYIHLNLTVYVQDSYAFYNKILMKEIKADLKKWREILYPWTQHSKIINSPQTHIHLSHNCSQNPSKPFL